MDKIKSAADLVVKINQYNDGELHDYELIRAVCAYFDEVKDEPLTDADRQFLYYIANQIGIPQYYDTLTRFAQNTQLENISMQVFADAVKESMLYTAKDAKMHRYQKDILERFKVGRSNRYFLSASTSFGKTFLVYEVIRKMQYRNIVLLFPSIALLSENLEKIYSNPEYAWIKDNYKIHTITSISEIGEQNIFLYTPERYLSFLDVSEFSNIVEIDFVFVDEVYKIDNDYIIDEEIKENERDVAYRLALHYALGNRNTDCLLAGPYIQFGAATDVDYNPSFDRFMTKNAIELLDYNNYDIVNKASDWIKERGGKINTYLRFIHEKIDAHENVIVYCSTKTWAEKYAQYIVEDSTFAEIDMTPIADFYRHVTSIFEGGEGWIVAKALRKGVGIHHGLVPKYIQKEIINLFNQGYIRVLISTTTITEGVNTTAKNVLILSYKKGTKVLKAFDAKNIEGRAGRFLQHYKGNVYYLDKKYEDVRNAREEAIKHKYYDERAPKQDVDLYYVDTQYLSQKDVSRKNEIDVLRNELRVPDEILNQFKVISKNDKLLIYRAITQLTADEKNKIEGLIQFYHVTKNISFDGFEVIVKLMQPFVPEGKLKSLMIQPVIRPWGVCSSLTMLVYTYFKYGLASMVRYSYKHRAGMTIDKAVREATDLVYNTFKYHVVKYFGAFNVMYKYHKSKIRQIPYDQVSGIDIMLIRMEYNATTQHGRIASDYGVSKNVLDYYEAEEDKRGAIRQKFDAYEQALFERIDGIIME